MVQHCTILAGGGIPSKIDSMKGTGTILGLLFALVLLFLGVSQIVTAEAAYIPPVSGALKDLLHALDFFVLLFVGVIALGLIYGVVSFATGRR